MRMSGTRERPDNQPEWGKTSGEEVTLLSRRHGSKKNLGLEPDIVPLSRNPLHGIVGEGEYGVTMYVFYLSITNIVCLDIPKPNADK